MENVDNILNELLMLEYEHGCYDTFCLINESNRVKYTKSFLNLLIELSKQYDIKIKTSVCNEDEGYFNINDEICEDNFLLADDLCYNIMDDIKEFLIWR